MSNITAVVIAYNEEHIIEGCLKTLYWCDSIIVIVDSRTNDNTADICKRYTDKVYFERFEVGFGEFRIKAMEHVETEWVIPVDADERISPELAKKIGEIILDDRFDIIYFSIAPYAWGRYLLSLSKIEKKFAFRISKGKFLPNTHNLFEPMTGARTISLDNETMYHYSHPTLRYSVEKTNRFTDFIANELNLSGSEASTAMLLKTLIKSLLYYFIRVRVYKDGIQGVFFGLNSAYAETLAVMKLYEIQNKTVDDYERKIA